MCQELNVPFGSELRMLLKFQSKSWIGINLVYMNYTLFQFNLKEGKLKFM